MGEKQQLVSLSFVFQLAFAVAVFTSQARAADLCSGAVYVPLCQSVVKGESDPTVALKAAISHLILETKEAWKEIIKLSDTICTNCTICTDCMNCTICTICTNCMRQCKEYMDYVVSSLEDTFQRIKVNDEMSVNVYLSSALTYYSVCDDGVIELRMAKVFPSVLKTDERLMQLARNCLHLSTLIKYGSFLERD